MAEWNISSGGPSLTLEEILEKIRRRFQSFKGGPVLRI
jgi:hypothetical protein